MALFHVGFRSAVLGQSVSVSVILPQTLAAQGGKPPSAELPTLWLLHGAGDDHTAWQRLTSIERYAAEAGLAVVMPAAALSSYTNMAHGPRYFDYVADELPEACRSFFPRLSARRETSFIAGLSMGCYGALKIGLSRPGSYAAIGGFSGGNSIFNRNIPAIFNVERRNILTYGTADPEALRGTVHDLYRLAEDAVASGTPLPRIFHACGTEDFAYHNALELSARMESLAGNPFRYEFHQGPGGHTWEFWDARIREFISWLTKGGV